VTGSLAPREDFPGLLSYEAYLNTAAIGLAPRPSRDALLAAIADYFLDPYRRESETLEELDRASRLLQQLYGFDPARSAYGESTTHMMVRAATALAGEGLIGVTEHDFPGVIVALRSACRRLGCRVGVYRGQPEEALLQALEEGARVLATSSVYWVTGHRLDTGRIARAARRAGAYLVVDAIQHLGGILVEEDDLEADAFCAASKKWLLAPHSGLAICHLSTRALQAEPAWYGLNNAQIPDKQAYWADPHKDLETLPPLREDAHRYTAPSGINHLQALALRTTLEYHQKLGPQNIHQHILQLARELAETAIDAGLQPHTEKPQTGIILLHTNQPHHKEAQIAQRLRQEGYAISHRGQAGIHGIRVSIHAYNNTNDINKLITRLKQLL